MSEYIPFPACATDAPVDISFVFQEERPAGKHGFLTVQGDRFLFEDGTEVRFWGTNLNGGACFPEQSYAKKLARRLAKFGVNLVRFHQLDAEWNTPNLFQLAKGAVRDNTREFDPESMDRLDYLIYCLKNEGIYMYLDLLTYRRFKTGDGVENACELPDAAKPYCIYNRRMIELQKEFARNLFCHVNPYTGLAYREEPAIILSELVNECDLFSRPIKVEPYVSEFRGLFRQWLTENQVEYDAEDCDLMAKEEPLLRFKKEVHDQYYLEMRDFLREIGVKVPLTGTNWSAGASLLRSNELLDFTDSHTYHYDWRWTVKEKLFLNQAPSKTEDFGMTKLCRMRSLDKPFFVSEWDVPWPNPYRAESPILFAAIGALQGWNGFAIHTYSYNPSQENMKILGKEMQSDAISGIPYREGIFSTWNDPAKFGLFYHSALILRRGDVSPAAKRIAAKLALYPSIVQDRNADDASQTGLARYNAGSISVMDPAMRGLPEVSRLGTCFEEREDVDFMLTEPISPIDKSSCELFSDTGEMYRNWKKGFGWVDTEMTKCVYGFLKKAGQIELKGMTIRCETDFAVIAASALSGKSLASANNILLTTVGRARNRDAQFDGDKMLSWGTEPIEVEVIRVEISLKTEQKRMKVWSVSPEGVFAGVIPSTWEDGTLHFTLGENWSSMYYLIQAE